MHTHTSFVIRQTDAFETRLIVLKSEFVERIDRDLFLEWDGFPHRGIAFLNGL